MCTFSIQIWNSRKCMKRNRADSDKAIQKTNVPSYSSLDMMGIFFPLWAMPQLFLKKNKQTAETKEMCKRVLESGGLLQKHF